MTKISAAEYQAMIGGKGTKTKPAKPPPIKVKAEPPEEAPHRPAMDTQLDRTGLDKVLTEVAVRTPETAYMEVHPHYLLVHYKGHELVLVPREQVKAEYLRRTH